MAWHAKAKGGYGRDSTEGQENALEMANTLKTSRGWTTKSCAAMLGNSAGEGGINPWRWESDNVPTYNQFLIWSESAPMSHGYGLFGFTPAKSYINDTNASKYAALGYGPNFSDRPGKVQDGAAQTAYFSDTVESAWAGGLYNYYKDDFAAIGVNIDDFYYITYEEFEAGKKDGKDLTIAQLTGAFELKYEKPSDTAAASSYKYRVQSAQWWYEFLAGHPEPPGPTPTETRSLPIYFYLRRF